jgi:SAM-dependent methyltransferase
MTYQTFPSVPGDSRSLDKLRALRLPLLSGKSFLDVGCNEGFFCGFALFAGASSVIGIDRSEATIAAAKKRFPECDFRAQSWDVLPSGPFDVILLASALHYATDQPELVRRLLEQLAPGGTLVLEIGVLGGHQADWASVRRSIDVRNFPTWQGVTRMLEGWAWKHIGPSVNQSGDPVGRHVVHVTHRLPIAYLLMSPPAYGKSSICRSLFCPAGVTVVSGDEVLSQVACGKLNASPGLAQLASKDFSPLGIDRTTQEIFASGLAAELIDVWIAQVPGRADFALDAYVPEQRQDMIVEQLRDRGYLVVKLGWSRVGTAPQSVAAANAEAADYCVWLENRTGVGAAPVEQPLPRRERTVGNLEYIKCRGNQVEIRGWAVDPCDEIPDCLFVQVGKAHYVIDKFERQQRPDVKRHLQLRHSLVGFLLSVPLGEGVGSPPVVQVADARQPHGVRRPFRHSAQVWQDLE